jgi:hypothetical protein
MCGRDGDTEMLLSLPFILIVSIARQAGSGVFLNLCSVRGVVAVTTNY